MKSVINAFIVLALSVLTASAWAYSADAIANRVKQLDTNKDGGVSMAEAIAGDAVRIKDNFAKLDANNDGKVTVIEIEVVNKAK